MNVIYILGSIAALITLIALVCWRFADATRQFKDLMWNAYEEARTVMDDAQRARVVQELVALRSLVNHTQLKCSRAELRGACRTLYDICLEWRNRGHNYWNQLSGENGVRELKHWLEACESLLTMQQQLTKFKFDYDNKLPRLHGHHVQSIRRSLSGLSKEKQAEGEILLSRLEGKGLLLEH